MNKFTEQYEDLLKEARSISTIFEYKELLVENPDDFYNIDGSSSFILYKDFYAIATESESGGLTHGDILLSLEAFIVNEDELGDDIKIGGKIPDELKGFFYQTYTGETECARDPFLYELSFSILGRINSNEKIVSFWNPAEDFTQSVIDNVIKLVSKIYRKKPNIYRYELSNPSDYYDSELLSYEEFINLAQYVPSGERVKSSSSHILHNIDPAIKAEIMKGQGIKPKKALGAEARFMMGESFESFYRLIVEEKPPLVHITSRDFSTLDPDKSGDAYNLGTHFGPTELAPSFCFTHRDGLRSIPRYDLPKNPIRLMDNMNGTWFAEDVVEQLIDLKIMTGQQGEDMIYTRQGNNLPERIAARNVRKFLMKKGYDAIVYKNRAEGLTYKDGSPVDPMDTPGARSKIYKASDEEFFAEYNGYDCYIILDPNKS